MRRPRISSTSRNFTSAPADCASGRCLDDSTMNLFLLRHGLAVERTLPGFKLDSDRPLTPAGRRKIGRLATLLSRLDLRFDLILTSPYVRARQTAEIVAEALHLHKSLALSTSLTPSS